MEEYTLVRLEATLDLEQRHQKVPHGAGGFYGLRVFP